MRRPDILLVKPGSQRKLYGKLSAFDLTAIEPPLWVALLAGYLRGLGYQPTVLDAEAAGLSPEEVARYAVEMGPLVTVVMVSGTNPSASTMNMAGAGRILSELRSLAPEARSLVMGLHPSALPERTMDEEACDYLCQGEGFYTLPPLLDALRAGAEPREIPGLWRRDQGRAVPAPRPQVLEDLDALPVPAWDLLPMERYRAHNWHCFHDIGNRQPYGVLYTSLGCPYRCSFCCINSFFGKPGIRLRSVDKVLEDLDLLVQRYGVRNIKIIDEMFALREDRVVELCQAIESREYGLNMWAYARVNTVTPRMLAAMKSAGINWVAYGFESGSRRVLEEVSKGYDPSKVGEVVRATYSHGLYICANYIFGLPGDDYDSMQETLSAMMDVNAQWANIYCAMAYPGSRLHEEALAAGMPLPESWSGYSQYSPDSMPLPTRNLSGGQVLAFRDFAFHAYHSNPRYLDMLRRTFGEATVRHVMGMTSRRLPRLHTELGGGMPLHVDQDA